MQYQEKLKSLLLKIFPGARILLFGSRAKGTAEETSDFDIAIDTGNKIEHRTMRQTREKIDNLNLPVTVDLIDLQAVSEKLRKRVLAEGITWND